MPKVIVISHTGSNVVFDFGTITAYGALSVDLTDKQLQALQGSIAADTRSGRPARFSFTPEVARSVAAAPFLTASASAPVTATEGDKELEQMSDQEVRDLYQATLGNPGNKKRKRLVEELRRAGA